ncbi:MAG: hypothetical protein JWM87_1535 [Candidatus Eremiobacteraeota bacterium]|nr:hypothetical protein [Candidatus Eremiobacteraeota bacterium]
MFRRYPGGPLVESVSVPCVSPGGPLVDSVSVAAVLGADMVAIGPAPGDAPSRALTNTAAAMRNDMSDSFFGFPAERPRIPTVSPVT